MLHSRPALDRDDAISAYLKYSDRLPHVAKRDVPGKSERVSNLLAIADQFDLIVFDAFGVLNSGSNAIPGSVTAVKLLKKLNKRLAVITNDASNTAEAIIAKHRSRGFDFDTGALISSAQFIVPMMQQSDVTRWGVMAPAEWPIEILPGDCIRLEASDGKESRQAQYDSVEGFLLIDSDEWTHEQQVLLEQSLAKRPRPILVGNPDIVAPMGNYLSAESGYFAHKAADCCGVTPRCVGKPYREVFDEVLRRNPDISPDRILMVGDTLHTDVLGGLAAGIKTLLVTQGGFLDGYQDLETLFERCGLRPHFIARSIGNGLEKEDAA